MNKQCNRNQCKSWIHKIGAVFVSFPPLMNINDFQFFGEESLIVEGKEADFRFNKWGHLGLNETGGPSP